MAPPKKKTKDKTHPQTESDAAAAVRAVRIKPADYALIERAAQIDRRPVSQFIVVAAIERAERILSEHEGENGKPQKK
jgi:uncharacterized protein (DUF1778 family)